MTTCFSSSGPRLLHADSTPKPGSSHAFHEIRVRPDSAGLEAVDEAVKRADERCAVVTRNRLGQSIAPKDRPDDRTSSIARQVTQVLGETGKPAVSKNVHLNVRDIESRNSLAPFSQQRADRSNGMRSADIADDRHHAVARLQRADELKVALRGEEAPALSVTVRF